MVTPIGRKGRKKAFAPKVRTGCDTCKTRRIKCGEERPTCVRCERKGVPCHYTLPAAWIFNTSASSSPSSPPASREREQQLMLTAALSDPNCTPEEKQSLNFFVTKLGPWFGDHGPTYARDYWITTLPRSFHLAPATKHLITAIGLLEQPAVFDPDVLRHREQRIRHHHTLALTAMTQPNIHPLDIALAPMLAWVLEGRTGNYAASAVHAGAIDRLSRQNQDPATNGSPPDISSWQLDTVATQMVRSQELLPASTDTPVPLAKVPAALAVRNRACRSVTAKQLLQRFEVYYDAFRPNEMLPEEVVVADAFIQRAMSEIMAAVYRLDTNTVLFAALHFLCLLSTQVLPRALAEPRLLVADPVVVGMEYVLEQCEDIRMRKLRDSEEQEVLQRTVDLMVRVMREFAPEEWRRRRWLRFEKVGVYAGSS